MDVRALGIDIGSATAKIVGIDVSGALAWQLLEPAEPRVEDQVERFLACAQQAMGSLTGIPLVATGCGRGLVHQASRKVTEITCHARGIYREFQRGGTLVDIGGQDSKVIRVTPQGNVVDFAMNDKCAAGTGRFLENMARRLSVSLEQMGPIALAASEEVPISSTCTVFAESEAISLIAHGVSPEPILRGLHRALTQRIVAMIRSVGLAPPLLLSGGVALNPAIRHMLEEEMNTEVTASRQPQLVGAHGAALLAMEIVSS
ncbi:MAG TPA: acyl-CoA dehydratase activase [Anaerolineae bacterium]|nr:acyl-CoA dehydratase activase [Anaerolineae bacterium]